MINLIKTIILDFDGVIIESVDIKTEAFKELYKNHPKKINEIIQYHLDNNALSRFIKFKYITENILNEKYDNDVKEKLGKNFSEIVFNKVVECPNVNGSEEFLKYFSKKYPLYIASNTPQKELEEIIQKRKLTKYFKKIFGSPPGNKINFIQEAIKNENAKENEVIYIGDMIEDFRIAQKTGVNFIGRKNVENLDVLNIPNFSSLTEIKEWIINQTNLGEGLY